MKKENKHWTFGHAEISLLGTHRFLLQRAWDEGKPTVMFIGLNPSRADAKTDDATIIRCVNFAKAWGYGSMYFGNLYSYRTPYVYKSKDDEAWEPLVDNLPYATTHETNHFLRRMITDSQKIVCCWGSWSFITERAEEVKEMVKGKGFCFGINANGSPKHPLYLPNNSTLKPFC